jgi:hypothetical protein
MRSKIIKIFTEKITFKSMLSFKSNVLKTILLFKLNYLVKSITWKSHYSISWIKYITTFEHIIAVKNTAES